MGGGLRIDGSCNSESISCDIKQLDDGSKNAGDEDGHGVFDC